MTVSVFISEIYRPDRTSRYALPLFLVHVSAGFPSPSEDFLEGRLDLNRYLIKHPAASFFVRVTGDSMINAGIHPNDLPKFCTNRGMRSKRQGAAFDQTTHHKNQLDDSRVGESLESSGVEPYLVPCRQETERSLLADLLNLLRNQQHPGQKKGWIVCEFAS